MHTETIELQTSDGPMAAYVARPDGDDDPRGAIVVIQEAFGVNDHIEDVTRRFAEAGYEAIAPHLFHRAGGGTAPYDDFSKVLPLFEGLSDAALLADVDAAVAHLEERGYDHHQIGIVGFYGGGIVTARFPQFPALIDQVPNLQTPWLGLFGDQDESIPVEDVERLRDDLDERATVPHSVVRYPNAGHGFHCDVRDSYDGDAAADGWRRTIAWFEQNLR